MIAWTRSAKQQPPFKHFELGFFREALCTIYKHFMDQMQAMSSNYMSGTSVILRLLTRPHVPFSKPGPLSHSHENRWPRARGQLSRFHILWRPRHLHMLFASADTWEPISTPLGAHL